MTDSTSRHTTVASYGLAIQKALEANGYDASDIFKAAGIEQLPSPDPMDRLTTAQVAALFRESVKRSGNPAFGLTVARFMHPSSIHALGYAHSVEAWEDGRLVGGLYGVSLGRCFFGESMFTTAPDASMRSSRACRRRSRRSGRTPL